jgi:hypothetical protein
LSESKQQSDSKSTDDNDEIASPQLDGDDEDILDEVWEELRAERAEENDA